MERVSMLQIADWLVQSGVDPDKLTNVAKNADKLANVYVPMSPGWQNAPPETIIGKLALGGAQNYTDETGEAPPPALTQPAAEMINTDAFAPQIMNQSQGELEPEDDAGGSLADIHGSLADFGITPPPNVDVASMPYMAPPPSVTLPEIGGMPNGLSDAGGYGNNESGRDYTRLPFVPDQNDNFIEGAYGPEFDGQGRFAGGANAAGSGGSGQGASETYWNLRNKLENLGGGSYGSSGYGGYSGGGGGYYDPSEANLPKNRGFSKKYNEEQLASTIQGRPTAILPRLGIDDEASYGYLSELPIGDLLALSDAGTRKKGWYGRSRTTKSGYVIPPKFKQGKYTNALAGLYKDIQAGGGPSTEEMLQNLFKAKKKSYVGQQFGKKVSVGDQASAASQYLDTIRQTQGIRVGAGQSLTDQMMIDQWAEKNMRKKKPGRLNKYLRQQGVM